jgi:hypothetical protein
MAANTNSIFIANPSNAYIVNNGTGTTSVFFASGSGSGLIGGSIVNGDLHCGGATGGSYYVTDSNFISSNIASKPEIPYGLSFKKIRGNRYKIGDRFLDIDPSRKAFTLDVPLGCDPFILELPDKSRFWVNPDGSYELYNDEAVVVHKANNIREFNRFLNASDLLEQFIRDLGQVGVKQDQVLEIPIGLFINWLIVKSAEQDGEEVPADIPKLPEAIKKEVPKCSCCGKFLNEEKVKRGLTFCNADHYAMYERRLERKEALSSLKNVLFKRSTKKMALREHIGKKGAMLSDH